MSRKATQGNKTGDGPQSAIRDPQSRQKILIVDDRKENLVALRQALAGVDAEIIEARNGNEALAATLNRRFAVAILDVMMPGMSGYELAEHLRGDDQTKVIPIVFVTASYTDEQHMFKGYEAGGVDYIIKPFDPKVLLSKVLVFLELDRYREELRQHRDALEALVGVRTAQLREHIKEIQCLYAVSSLVAKPCESIHEALRAAADLIPAGLQYPDIACARIRFGGREFATANFKETPWSLSAEIVVEDPKLRLRDSESRVPDSFQVCYLEERPEADEGPFLKEERHLVNDITRMLGVMIERERWRTREQHLNVVLRSIRDVNQLIVREKHRDRLIRGACENLVSTRGFLGAWIVLNDRLPHGLDSAQVGFAEADFAALADQFREGRPPRCCRLNTADEVLIVTRDPSESCNPCPLAQAYRGNSTLTVALRHKDRDFGWLGVSVPAAFADDEQEASLLREIADDIAFALHGIETETERRRSADTLRAIFESASDGILLADAESGRFVRGNDAICRMLGYSHEEIAALSVADIHPPEALDSVRAQFNRQVRGEITLAADLPMKRKDGTVFPADVNAGPFELEGRRHLVGIIRDITERKRAEEALEESEEKYRAIVEQSTDGIVITDQYGAIDIWNASMEAITGLHRCNTIGKPVSEVQSSLIPDEFITPELLKQLQIGTKAIFESKMAWPGESREQAIKCADGTRKVVQDSSFIIKIGESVRLGTILRDITERKRAEDALQTSERFSRNLIESMGDGFAVLDENGVHIDVNPAFCRMIGFTPEELIGSGPPHPYWPEEEYGRIQIAFSRTMKKDFVSFELVFKRKNGERFPVIVTPSSVKDARGRATSYFATVKDITERKRAEEALRESELLHTKLAIWNKTVGESSIAFSEAKNGRELFQRIADSLRKLTGGIMATSSSYDARTAFLTVAGLSVDNEIRNMVEPMVKNLASATPMLVSPEMRMGMLKKVINIPRSLTELTFGAIPEDVSGEFMNAVGIGEMVALSLHFGSELEGTAVAFMGNGLKRPTDEVLRSFAYMAGLALAKKRMDQSIAQSEERYRTLVSNLNAGIVVHAADTRILFSNAMASVILGLTPDQLLGKTAKDPSWYFVREDNSAMPLEEFPVNMIISEKKTLSNYLLGINIPGEKERKWVLCNGFPVLGADGDIQQVIITFIDISDRKTAEEALWQSHELLRVVLDNIPARVFWKDRGLNYLGCNRAFARDAGFERPEDLVGKDDFAMGWREQAERYRGDDCKVIEDGIPRLLIEEPQTTPSGETIHLLTSKAPLRDVQGAVIGVLGTYMDITELKRAEEALRRFERAVETSSDAVGMSTPQGKHYYQNKAFDDMFGYVGEDPSATLYADKAAGREVFETIMSGREWTGEIRMRGKRGNILDILLRAYPMKDQQGAITGLVGVHTDMTAQRSMEAQLRQAQKLESIGTLASGVAHEINNPIMGVMNYAQLILDKLGPDSPVAEFATEIGKETERVATIVKNLLFFARVEKKTHSLARICDIVEGALSLVRTVLRHDQITLEVDVPEDLPKIKCRSQQIQQVVMNLITNARDALNEKYPGYHEDKKMLVRAELGSGCVRLTVEDHGPGIPEDIRERIFDPFFTTKPRDRGTGLGLSISHGIVRDHLGELSMESEIGEWTRFRIDLPVDKIRKSEREQGGKQKAKEISEARAQGELFRTNGKTRPRRRSGVS